MAERATNRRTPILLLVVVLLAGGATLLRPEPATAQDDEVTVTFVIEAVRALDSLDTLDGADFYPQVVIGGGPQQGGPSLEITDDDDIQPNWTFTQKVPMPSGVARAPIHVELYDADGAFNGPRDHVDITGNADRDLDIEVDLTACALKSRDTVITGDVTGQCGAGVVTNGVSDDKASMRFKVTVDAPDADGDGLFDVWETNGYDADGVGGVDVDLPAMGADPNHKDIFLELDVTSASRLDRADILAVKRAFAAAPIDAGTQASQIKGGVDAKPNPDGKPGITLHVDTGMIVDSTAREGQPMGTCSDGIDNGGDDLTDAADPSCSSGQRYLDATAEDPGAPNCTDGTDNDDDGQSDAADPDCLLGDNLGGGSVVAAPSPPACNLDANYYATKAGSFSPTRSRIFRWALSLSLDPSCPASGGWGEIGGNDFMEFNFDGGTLMHELGHTLNLDHGGFEPLNCKPNYVSVMNYDIQSGVRRVGGGSVLDYSPPRLDLAGTTRGAVPGMLDENSLDENSLLDATDAVNRFVYTDTGGNKRTLGLNTNPNYNNDTDPPLDSAVQANINNSDTAGNPSDCGNMALTRLNAQNDWLRVSLPFVQFGDAADGAVNPVTGPELTATQLRRLEDAVNATDLALAKTGPTADVAAGTTADFRLEVRNSGANPAPGVMVTDTPPAGTTVAQAPAGCASVGAALQCGLGELLPGASRGLGLPLAVRPDLVYDNGGPLTITNSARVAAARGADANPGNDGASAAVRIVAVADLGVTATVPDAPTELIIGKPQRVTLATTTSNGGPSSPMDVRLRGSATAEPGSSAAPASSDDASRVLTAVGVRVPQPAQQEFTISCEAPGEHTFTLRADVSPNRADDTDPREDNNAGSVAVTVDCIVPVAVNIKPKDATESVNRDAGSDVPIAVLTTTKGEYGLPLDFDATRISPTTTRFGTTTALAAGSGSRETHGRNHLLDSYELDDKTRDRDLDDVQHFVPAGAGLLPETTEACVKGKFAGPADQSWTFLGCGRVRIVK